MAGLYDTPEMIDAFLEEVEEQLEVLEQSILELEQNGETPEVIQKIFRVAHTLKGSSSAMGFEEMKILTHEMENVLDEIRNHRLKATKTVINALFQCLDQLRMLKQDFVSDRNNIKTDISSTVNKLKEILSGGYNQNQYIKQDKGVQNTEQDNKTIEFELDFDQRYQLIQALKSELNILVCKVKISDDSLMKTARAYLILNYFNQMGNVITTEPNVIEPSDDIQISDVYYLLITKLDAKTIKAKILNELVDIDNVDIYPYDIKLSEQQAFAEHREEQINRNKISVNTYAQKRTIRVDVERVEKLVDLVGELVIEQTRIYKVGNELHSCYISDGMVDELLMISNHVSRVISELQEGVMKMRMLPIQQLFNRFPRIVRDLAEALGKEVELVIEGEETELDKTIIEDIADPLIHLIRNAIDHGIEPSEERISIGKPPKGKLIISAFYQENHVVLIVQDDGRGIDVQKVKECAIKKGIITEKEADTLTEQEIINLIFHTGFSTSQEVNEISGRGVGMDIVRNHIEKLNGIIEVETKHGEGTKFTIKLPLTLAILPGLLVRISDEVYALPMSNVVEIVRKPENEIGFIKGQAITLIREKVLPLIWLHDYFNIQRIKMHHKNIFIVVLGVAEKRFGLVVDELIGTQEIVVKPLGSYIGKVETFSGATILGDGSVACILDVGGIAKMVENNKILTHNM